MYCQKTVVHLLDKGRFNEEDSYRLLCILQPYGDKVDTLEKKYKQYFSVLRLTVVDAQDPIKSVSDYLARAARLRLEYCLRFERLQMERRLQGELFLNGFAGSMTNTIVGNRINWLFNRATDVRAEAVRMGLPLENRHLQYH